MAIFQRGQFAKCLMPGLAVCGVEVEQHAVAVQTDDWFHVDYFTHWAHQHAPGLAALPPPPKSTRR
jgi:hypothetical protein